MGGKEKEFAEKVLNQEFGDDKTKIVDLLLEIKLPITEGRKSVFFITLFL